MTQRTDDIAWVAQTLIGASLDPHLDHVALNVWAARLAPHARRIARNALRADNLMTDNRGQPLVGASGAPLGVLWTYTAPGCWLSMHVSQYVDPALALAEWAAWAHDGPPPYRVTLVDANVPLLGRGPLGVSSSPGRDSFTDLVTATRNAYVVSVTNTCQLQGRDPVAFMARLLRL